MDNPGVPVGEGSTNGEGQVDSQLDWVIIERLLVSFQLPPCQAAALVRDLYECELSIQISALAAAVQANDRPQAARLAHKLRGGSKQIGALGLAAVSAALEGAAKDPGRPTLSPGMARIRASYDRTRAGLLTRLGAIIEGE
jgi:HPt (histidine-containing phosphotransfer) domain-containing protein